MRRYVWTMQLRPGCAEAYTRMHREIWPEMIAALTSAGVRAQTIHRKGDMLIGVLDVDDLAQMLDSLGRNEAAARWQQAMAKLAFNERDPATGYLPVLEDVFSLEAAIAKSGGGHVAGS